MKHSQIEPLIRQIVKPGTNDAEIRSLVNAIAAIDSKLNKIFTNYVDEKYSFRLNIIEKEQNDNTK